MIGGSLRGGFASDVFRAGALTSLDLLAVAAFGGATDGASFAGAVATEAGAGAGAEDGGAASWEGLG